MGDTKFWSHKWTLEKLKKECKSIPKYATHYNDSHKIKKGLEKSLTNTLNGLRTFLVKYGYLKHDRNVHQFISLHVGNVDCNSEMKSFYREYNELDKEMARLTLNLISVEKEKGKAISQDIWDRTS